ncbi:LOW QUALITY PROTEIN: nuclear pore complex protein Nup50-like [Manduca sexta]|uniref:LOW QUALITY PROTEIN: nuclear pore complex protein Nup50-like n=1 Tax=Manduca sexta TaxID=7130 RepID=UPI0018906392|nr:LOW QUALITY PROTEIN: nuclear pore complex protein Nup50-like [Manduca sexta]
MSVKRQATTELNHENWDQEDPEEQDEVGTFKTASKEALEKRVIRTAKRRTQASGDETKKGVFSGFGGFNKTQPSSFDFLANLTNGNKNANNDKTTKSDTPVSSNLFSSKPGIFGTTSSPVKSLSGSSNTQTTGNLFSTSPITSSSVFTAIKADSTVKDSPFKIQPATKVAATSPVTSNIFGISSTSGTMTIPGKSLFASTNNTLFKTQPTSSAAVLNTNSATNINNAEKKSDDKSNEKKITYYTKLKGLNESVLDWIKKHVEETPLCILTPIFKDYEKYLKEMQDEYEGKDKEESSEVSVKNEKSQSVAPTLQNNKLPQSSNNISSGMLASKTDSPTAKPSIFGNQNNTSTFAEKPSGFSFGINSSSSVTSTTSAGFTFGSSSAAKPITTASAGFTFGNKISNVSTGTAGYTLGNNSSTSVTTTASTGFTFGITSTSSATTTTASPFSLSPSKTINTNGTASFQFGTGKPFSFSSNITQKAENTKSNDDAQEEEDTPPKVEFTPIAEENSVFDKRCKIFVKKDANFVDKGVGTLYLKIDNTDKHQLLVRANTTLGNVLLNLRLSSAIPTQRMGKNNVMLVCIPTPEAKPPPTPVLVRVKTSEEADELLETINKYKS